MPMQLQRDEVVTSTNGVISKFGSAPKEDGSMLERGGWGWHCSLCDEGVGQWFRHQTRDGRKRAVTRHVKSYKHRNLMMKKARGEL